MPRNAEVFINAEGLPKVKELFAATHAVLVARLVPPHEISTDKWNRLIAAHDALVTEDAEE